MWSILFMVLTVIILVCVWIVIYDSNRFVVRNYSIQDTRIHKKCRAVVLADLHNKKYGKDNALLVEAIREAKPDLILIAGDILTAKPGAKPDTALQLLEVLASQYPVYYGNGNHEHRLNLYPDVYGDLGEVYREGLEKIGIRPLINEHITLTEYGITIYGSQIDRCYYKRFGKCGMEEGYLATILGDVDKSTFSILLAHNPDYFPQYAIWGADLILSGHLHGGMVRIPFWGKGVVSPGVRLFPKYDGGKFEEGSSTMLVSRGLGMHTIPVRLFNPGELLVLDLEPEIQNVSSA